MATATLTAVDYTVVVYTADTDLYVEGLPTMDDAHGIADAERIKYPGSRVEVSVNLSDGTSRVLDSN
jgi:hypothetical protein